MSLYFQEEKIVDINTKKNDPVLAVRNLSIDFIWKKKRVSAVSEVSFDLFPGETLGIVGESGCGKSLTASAIMRLLPQPAGRISGGQIFLGDINLLALSRKQLNKIRGNEISMIFQDPMTSLNPVYTVEKQLLEIIFAHRKMPLKEARRNCLEMLERVGIPAPEERLKKYPHELSGGMRQRVMIAMALLSRPKVLIADEPTTALDVTIQAQILELINELKNEFGTAVILITHDMGVIAETADRVLVMYAGEIVEQDRISGLFNNPVHPYTKGLLSSIPRFDRELNELYNIPGSVPSLGEFPEGCRFCNRCEKCDGKCREYAPELKDYDRIKMVRCHYAG